MRNTYRHGIGVEKMDQNIELSEIAESLRRILSELDETHETLAAIKVAEAINFLSKMEIVRQP